MTDFDPNDLAKMQFEGTDIRLLDRLIEDAENKLGSARKTLESYQQHIITHMESFEPSGQGDQSKLRDAVANNLSYLREQVVIAETKLEELRDTKERLIKGKDNPNKLQ